MPFTIKLPRIASTPTAATALADPARLRALPFLAGLDLDVLKDLSPNIEEQRFQAGDYILRAGQYCDGAYFISAGVVEARVALAEPAALASDPRAVARLRAQEYQLPASL